MLKGRSRDPIATEAVKKALFCKYFKCTPKELDDIDYEDLVLSEEVYVHMMEKNPFQALA